MKNSPSNSVSGVTSSSSRPTRLSPLVAGIAATVMSMTAASSAQADNKGSNVNYGISIGNTQRIGGGVDGKARAAAKAAAESAAAAQARLAAAERTLSDATAKAASAEGIAKDARTRLEVAEKKLEELEAKVRASSGAPVAPAKESTVTFGEDEGDTVAVDKKDKGDKAEPVAPPREITAEDIVNAKAVIAQRAEAARLRAEALRAEAQAKAACVQVLRAQADRANAAAELARAQAAEKAAKLAEAQAEADAARRNAEGLTSTASEANRKLMEARRESSEADGKFATADAEAARAKALLDAYGTGSSSVVVNYGNAPTWFGEASGRFSALSGNERRVSGGVGVGAFARLGENVAVGGRSSIEGGNRNIQVGTETVSGSSTTISAQAAVQLGAVQGSGFNFEGAAGVQRESMNGVAIGSDGSKLEGVAKTYPRFDVGANYYQQLTDSVRLRIGVALSFLTGRPTQLGSDEKETAVGGTVNVGISTK